MTGTIKVDSCRLCRCPLKRPVLSLPPTPLANEFVKSTEPQDLFPLEICVCSWCGHYQLTVSVEPERLFRNYLFVAGTSPINVEHFRKYAVHMIEKFNLQLGSRILDIASNDGTLLRQFLDLKMSVLGIDPARNLAEEATKNGIPTIPEFFTEERADKMLKQHDKFNVITANNVFAHVPDLADFAKGVKKLLKPHGVFSFEVSYFLDVCNKTLFDTIYHEHSSYHTLTPLLSFFKMHGMEVFDVERISNHGGSIRVFVRLDRGLPASVEGYNNMMSLYHKEFEIEKKVEELGKNIEHLGVQLCKRIQDIKGQGKSIAIYGTPAKATTLMYALGIKKEWIDFAVDDAPLKQWTYTPGMHIPVLPTKAIYEKKPDYLLVLAWNFADPIIANHKGFGGKFIVPIPELREV